MVNVFLLHSVLRIHWKTFVTPALLCCLCWFSLISLTLFLFHSFMCCAVCVVYIISPPIRPRFMNWCDVVLCCDVCGSMNSCNRYKRRMKKDFRSCALTHGNCVCEHLKWFKSIQLVLVFAALRHKTRCWWNDNNVHSRSTLTEKCSLRWVVRTCVRERELFSKVQSLLNY